MTVTLQELDKAIDKVVARNRRAGVRFVQLRSFLIRSEGSPSGCPLTASWRQASVRWQECAYGWIRFPTAKIIAYAADYNQWPKGSLRAHARRRLESELPGLETSHVAAEGSRK